MSTTHLKKLASLLYGSSDKEPGVYTSLTPEAKAFIIRKDDGDNGVIHVFSAGGSEAYTVQRNTRLWPRWIVYEASSRKAIAILTLSRLGKSVEFLQKPGFRHCSLTPNIKGHQFYVREDAAPFIWTARTHDLLRITNPGGGSEQRCERIASARLLRKKRFDWELLVDPNFEADIAVSTVLVAMISSWSTNVKVTPGSRTYTHIAKPLPPRNSAAHSTTVSVLSEQANLQQQVSKLPKEAAVNAASPATPPLSPVKEISESAALKALTSETTLEPLEMAGLKADALVAARQGTYANLSTAPREEAITKSITSAGIIVDPAAGPQSIEEVPANQMAYTPPESVYNFFEPPEFWA